jgi:hypothetical protein
LHRMRQGRSDTRNASGELGGAGPAARGADCCGGRSLGVAVLMHCKALVQGDATGLRKTRRDFHRLDYFLREVSHQFCPQACLIEEQLHSLPVRRSRGRLRRGGRGESQCIRSGRSSAAASIRSWTGTAAWAAPISRRSALGTIKCEQEFGMQPPESLDPSRRRYLALRQRHRT